MAANRLRHVRIFIEQKQVTVLGAPRPTWRGFREVQRVGRAQKALFRYYARVYITKPVLLGSAETSILKQRNIQAL
jgi:hypothetical protein